MTNFTAKIFNNAVSSLAAQQAVIANTANNIANVNTEGYARRVADLQTRTGSLSAGLNIGNGVEVAGVTRVNSEFLNDIIRSTGSDSSSLEVQDQFLSRAQQLFSLTGDSLTIGGALTEFFSSIDNLTVNPGSIELRSDMIERGEDLITAIGQTFNGLADLQTESEGRLAVEIDTVNNLTSQIAELNIQVASREVTGNVAADERDRRDVLLNQLSDKIGFEAIEGSDGQVNVLLGNGFPLVSGGNSRALEVTSSPSFADPTNNPYMLDGSLMSFVVYDYDSGVGSSHLNLTGFLDGQGGTVGGLLDVRGVADAGDVGQFSADGPLVELAARVESVTQQLLTTFNSDYIAIDDGDLDGGTAGFQTSARDLDGNAPAAFGFFDIEFIGAIDVDADSAPELSDLNALLFGGAVGTVGNMSSLLKLTSRDPRDIAAGRIGAVGETIGQGDADNLIRLSSAQTRDLTFGGTIGIGANQAFVDRTTTFSSFYNETVGRVGNLKARSEIDASVALDNNLAAKSRREEFSGVSLDEEFTSLIRFQKAFEANARLIRVGQEIMDNVLALL